MHETKIDGMSHLPRRPRLLMLAYDCIPGEGSDAGVGWHRAVQASRCCDTWVICREDKCAPKIRIHLETHGAVAGLHFVYVPHRPWERVVGRNWYSYYISYNSWLRRAFRVARRLHREIGFDLVHQVTFASFREPGYLWKLGPPFVWGPVGGTQNYPWRFLLGAGLRGAAHEALRSCLNVVQLRVSRRVRKAARTAAALIAANSTVQRDFGRVHNLRSIRLQDVGVTEVADARPASRADSRPLRLLWVGKLLHRKALHLLIEALGRLPNSMQYELRIVGSGPLENRWRRLAQRRGIESRCRWMGWLSHEESLLQFDWADVFVFTSLRDTTGTVVIEALSRGLPVICFDHQGAGDVVTEKCGVKVPVTNTRNAVARLRDAVVRLARHPTELHALSHGALERASRYLWTRQGERLAQIYEDLSGRRNAERCDSHSRDGVAQ